MNSLGRTEVCHQGMSLVLSSKPSEYNFYMAYLHKAEDGSFGVTLPDFPGCFTHVNSLNELSDMANEAISLHLNEGEELPRPRSDHVCNPEYNGGTWAIFSIKR